MIQIYHLFAGIITLFAAVQTPDGQAFVANLRKESYHDGLNVSPTEQTLRWGAYLSVSVITWMVAWPVIMSSWAITKIVKTETPAQNSETDEIK